MIDMKIYKTQQNTHGVDGSTAVDQHAAISGAVTMVTQAPRDPGGLLYFPAFHMEDLRR